MVNRKKAEQGATGAAKQVTDQDAANPKGKAGKAPAGNENMETRPTAETEGSPPARRKPAAKKAATPPAEPAGEPPAKAPARKPAAKAAQPTAKPEPKKTAAKTTARKTAPKGAEAENAEKAPLPTPAPVKKAAAKKSSTKTTTAKEAEPAPAKRTPAKAKAPAEQPARARSARRIDAAAATARPEPEDATPTPTRRAAPKGTQPATAVKTAPPAETASQPAAAEPQLAPPHREAAPPAAAAVPASALAPEAPAAPGATRVVLMIRDPEWLYAYWEISPADREAHAIGRPQGAPPLLVRVYDLGIEPQEKETGNSFDLTVLPDASGWYVHVPQSGGQWRVALGYLNYEGEFVAVATSNAVSTPSPIHAAWNEQTWGPVSAEQQMAEVAGLVGVAGLEEEVEEIGGPGGPSRLVRRAARLLNYLKGTSGEQGPRLGSSEQVPRMGASEQVPRLGASEQVPRLGASEQVPRMVGASEQVPRMGASEQFAAAPGSGLMMGRPYEISGEKGKTFWLQVYTELIVYGATEPDASVTVQGQPIRLRPDGTFTLRFALPDGEQVIPVRAVNVDGDMERTITPIVNKRTV